MHKISFTKHCLTIYVHVFRKLLSLNFTQNTTNKNINGFN